MANSAQTVSAAISAASTIASAVSGSSGRAWEEYAAAAMQAANTLTDGNETGIITNARVYLNSGTLLGKASKVTGLGMPKPKTSEVKSLGTLAPLKFHSGFEQPEITIDWNSVYAELSLFLWNPLAVQRFQIRSGQDVYTAEGATQSKAVVADIHGYAVNGSEPTLENGAVAGFNTKINVTYSKLTIGGTVCYEADYVNNIYKVNGIDVLSDSTSNM